MARSLTGEPVSVDLVNTRWRRDGIDVDLLADSAGVAQWLDEVGLADVPASRPVRAALLVARDAIRAAIEGTPGAQDAVNAVLARAVIVRTMQAGLPADRVLFADPGWMPAWRAVSDYAERAGAVRRCANPACVLCFYDPGGRRRWCSMASCGNRAKARRHHARVQPPAEVR